MDLKGKRVLVTGGAGFLGSHITEGLISKGAQVSVLDTLLSGRENNLAHLKGRVKFFQGDILDEKLVHKAMYDNQVVIHAAFPMAICDRSLNSQYIESGTAGIYNVLRAALAEETLFIYISSISVYGRQKFVPVTEEHPLQPMLLYGATKLAGELYCKVMAEEYGLRTVILRYSDIFGPRNGRISAPINFLLQSLENKPLIISGGGKQVRSYTYVSDAVDATILAMTSPEAVGQTINIAGDDYISINELARQVNKVTGRNLNIQNAEKDGLDLRNYIIDNTRAKKILGFKPRVTVEEGLRLVWQWLQEYPDYYNTLLKSR